MITSWLTEGLDSAMISLSTIQMTAQPHITLMVQNSSNSTVGESKYYLAPTVEAGQPLKTS